MNFIFYTIFQYLLALRPTPMAIAASVDMTDHSAVPEPVKQSTKESGKTESETDSSKKSVTPKVKFIRRPALKARGEGFAIFPCAFALGKDMEKF